MPGPFHPLVSAEKRLSLAAVWTPADPEDGYSEFVAPLEIAGVTIQGLSLRGGCYAHLPGEAMMFQLEIGHASVRTRIPLMRLDWRPLTASHKNPRKGSAAHAGRQIFGSHLHTFDLNWVEENGAMRAGNLPFAIEVSPDPRGFAEILDFVQKHFRISKVELIPEPNWSPRLL